MNKGTILINLGNGSQTGSQPAHMEFAAIIIGLALRRWQLPPQQGDIVYSDCKSITDVIKSTVPRLSKHPPNSPFSKRYFNILQHSAHKEPPLTGPNPIQNDDPHLKRTPPTTGAYYWLTVQHRITPFPASSGSNSICSYHYQHYCRPPSTLPHGSSVSPPVCHVCPHQSSSNAT